MNQENYLKMKDIESRNSNSYYVSGQDAIDLMKILSEQYLINHPDKPGGECPWCHSEEYCEHWSGLGWKNPNY